MTPPAFTFVVVFISRFLLMSIHVASRKGSLRRDAALNDQGIASPAVDAIPKRIALRRLNRRMPKRAFHQANTVSFTHRS